jgi:hypothetical protein
MPDYHQPEGSTTANPAPLRPDESLNSNYTAIPKDILDAGDPGADLDLAATQMDYGTMNEQDARESGYIAENRPKRRQTALQNTGGWNISPVHLALAATLGVIALFSLRRSSKRTALREVPAWLTAEAMAPAD